jgi:carboxymethylenebutenolidase
LNEITEYPKAIKQRKNHIMTIEIKEIQTLDGKKMRCHVARPTCTPRAAILVVQEIFGVTEYVQWVLQEQFAKAGYLAIAPAFFDRVTGVDQGSANNVLAYDEAGTNQGRGWVDAIGMDDPMRDLRAAQFQIAGNLPTGVVGYCWGGSVAFLASTRLGLPAVSYYGGRTAPYLHEKPQASVMLHFGENDHLITPTIVDATRKALSVSSPTAELFVYPAGHGFNRFGSKDFHADSSALALDRTLKFFSTSL